VTGIVGRRASACHADRMSPRGRPFNDGAALLGGHDQWPHKTWTGGQARTAFLALLGPRGTTGLWPFEVFRLDNSVVRAFHPARTGTGPRCASIRPSRPGRASARAVPRWVRGAASSHRRSGRSCRPCRESASRTPRA
jgi:hypothetical protein